MFLPRFVYELLISPFFEICLFYYVHPLNDFNLWNVLQVKGFPAWPARVQGRQPSGQYDSLIQLESRLFFSELHQLVIKFISGKYGIFFYGTYETASLKASEIWPFNEDNASKYVVDISQQKIKLLLENHSRFATENQLKRKGYSEGMEQVNRNVPPAIEVQINSFQIRNTPEIAPVLGDLEDLPSPAAKSRSSPSTPVVLKKPVRMLDGSPAFPPRQKGKNS